MSFICISMFICIIVAIGTGLSVPASRVQPKKASWTAAHFWWGLSFFFFGDITISLRTFTNQICNSFSIPIYI